MKLRSVFLASALLLFAASLWIRHLNVTLGQDESLTVMGYSTSLLNTFGIYSEPNNHILYSAIVWLTHQLGQPVQPLLTRIPAFYFALISLALFYRISRRYVPILASLFGLLCLIGNSTFATYAVSARGYSLTVLLTLALWWFCVERPSGRAALWLSMASMLTIPTQALMLAPAALWSLRWQRQLVVPIVLGSIAGGVFYIPSQVYFGLLTRHLGLYGLRDPETLLLEIGGVVWSPVIITALLITVVGATNTHPVTKIGAAQRAWIIHIVAAAFVLIFVQWAITGGLFYSRNYLYLIPFVILPVTYLLWQRGGTVGVSIALLCVLIMLIPRILAKPARTSTDVILEQLDQVPSEVAVILGCCEAQPVAFYAADHPALDPTGKSRWIVLPAADSLYRVLHRSPVPDDAVCTAIPPWEGLEVFECVPAAP